MASDFILMAFSPFLLVWFSAGLIIVYAGVRLIAQGLAGIRFG